MPDARKDPGLLALELLESTAAEHRARSERNIPLEQRRKHKTVAEVCASIAVRVRDCFTSRQDSEVRQTCARARAALESSRKFLDDLDARKRDSIARP